jgi:signal transduction histidine kinase
MQASFYDQLEGERFEFCFGRHWYSFAVRTATFFPIFIVLLLLPIFLHSYVLTIPQSKTLEGVFILAIFISLLVLIHRFFLWLVCYTLTFVIVTNLRIMVVTKSVFLVSEKEVLDLIQVRDIQMKKSGFFGNLLQYGEIHLVLSMQSKETTVIYDVPLPSEIQEKCNLIRHKRLQLSGKIPKEVHPPAETNSIPETPTIRGETPLYL